MNRSTVPHTTTSTHGRTHETLQRSAAIDQLVKAIERGCRHYDRQAAAAELQQLDAVGHKIIGKLFVHYLTEEFSESTSWLEDWAMHYARTAKAGDDAELVDKLTEVFDDDRYPIHMAEFYESEVAYCQGDPAKIEECLQKANELRELAAMAEGGAV